MGDEADHPVIPQFVQYGQSLVQASLVKAAETLIDKNSVYAESSGTGLY
jgi:hypothetical protein